MTRSLYCTDKIVSYSLSCTDKIVSYSLSCTDKIVSYSLSCTDKITSYTLLYVGKVATQSQSYREKAAEQNTIFIEMLKTHSFRYRNFLRATIKGTISSIPLEFKNGEFVINGRTYLEDETQYCNNDESAKSISGDSKKVYILLTKHSNILAYILRVFTFKDYTHTSIALAPEGEHYSFNPKRGFTVERPIKKKRSTTPCKLYCIEVSEESYAELEMRISWFINNPDEYKFNYVGLVLSILQIPVGIGNRYFCSQFVSDLLVKSGVLQLKRRPSKFMPRHFGSEPFMSVFDGEAGTFEREYAEKAN